MGKKIIYLVLALFVLIACTEEKKYKETVKPQSDQDVYTAKADLNFEGEFLYVPLVGNTPRSFGSMMPQYLGSEKVVRFEVREDVIDIVQVEKDARFANNPLNAMPVMSIPVEHLDYQCVRDEYNRCTNKEEEAEKLAWNQRRFINLKLSEYEVLEFNLLPIDLANLFGRNCFQKQASQVIDKKLSKDAIIISVEETYLDNCKNIFSIADIEQMTVRVVKHYNFIRLSEIASANYKELKYPLADSNILGLFKTENTMLGEDFNDDTKRKEVLASRWNPERQKIKYYLSSDFALPENKVILEATRFAVEKINKSLRVAGAKFSIELAQGNDRQVGDIRNSMIVMVSEPVESRILGYGPSFVNPHTGETLSARTVMYKGNLVTMIAREYGMILRDKIKAQAGVEATSSGLLDSVLEQILQPQASKASSFMTQKELALFKSSAANASQRIGSSFAFLESLTSVKSLSLEEDFMSRAMLPATDYLKEMGTVNKYTSGMSVDDMSHLKINVVDPIQLYASMNAFHEEAASVPEAIRVGVEDIVAEFDYRPWAALNDAERRRVIDVVLPAVWIPVLTHEIGHNLGLRHNFSGSEDKDNFYTEEELHAHGIDRPIEYSSVMDYALHEVHFIPVLGKYDIAALRYAYAGKVEVQAASGEVEIVEVPGLLSEVQGMKPYKYCSDENIRLNPSCNPFDKGTNLTEISAFQAEKRKILYEYRNKRNEKESLSSLEDINAYFSAKNDFAFMHLHFDMYERVRNIPALAGYKWELGEYPPDVGEGDKAFLQDINQAVINTGEYLIAKMLEPDAQCLLILKESGEQQLIPLTTINELVNGVAEDCLATSQYLSSGYLIAGQIGKPFNHIGTDKSQYADQIGVRGVWMEKIAAVNALFMERQNISVLDRVTTNYLTHPVVGPKLFAAVAQIVLDQVVADVTLNVVDGREVTVPGFSYSPSEMFKMEARVHPVVDYFLGMKSGQRTFAQEMLRKIKRSINNSANELAKKEQLAPYLAYKGFVCGEKGIIIGGERYCAFAENVIAQMALARLEVLDIVERVPRDRLEAIVKDMKQDKPSFVGPPTKSEVAVRELGVDILELYLGGAIKSKEVYKEAILMLAND